MTSPAGTLGPELLRNFHKFTNDEKKGQKCLQNTKILSVLNPIRTISAALVAY